MWRTSRKNGNQFDITRLLMLIIFIVVSSIVVASLNQRGSPSTPRATEISGIQPITGCESVIRPPLEVPSERLIRPDNAIDITIIFSSESCQYMPRLVLDFNRSYIEGKNPLTGQALAEGERPIFVTGQTVSAGTVINGIVNAVRYPDQEPNYKPTIWSPSVSHWLTLTNERANQEIFALEEAEPTAYAPVVMAIWESRLKAIQETVGYEAIGWEELLQVMNSPNGWCDYGIEDCRRAIYYGHTNPRFSSTGLSTLIAEYYASARQNGFEGRVLTAEQVNDDLVQQGVRNIEQMIRHYSLRTTEFKFYISQGSDYVDFVALEENDVIYINRYENPPETLIALHPKEGTIWHEHPFAIPDADWVTEEQQRAAREFTHFVLLPASQAIIMGEGFRPANVQLELAYPFAPNNGILTSTTPELLSVPPADILNQLQIAWSFVKKQSDVIIIIDQSGSMNEDAKIDQARTALKAFIESLELSTRVSLRGFNTRLTTNVPFGTLEENKEELLTTINSLNANGGTALYDSVYDILVSANALDQSDRIRTVILISDGQDTDSSRTLQEVIEVIQASADSQNPVLVFPVAYGSDADMFTLQSIADASETSVQRGSPDDIIRLLEIIGSYH